MADATELLSLTDLKAYLQISGAAYDAILGSIKASVESWVKNHCRDPFLVAERTEYLNGSGSEIIRVRHYPITEIDEVNVDASRFFEVETELTDYVITSEQNNAQGMIELFGYVFSAGQKNVKIVYSAGYSAIPADLTHAVRIICAREFLIQDKRLTGQSSQSVGDKTVSLSLEEIPRNAWDILQSYKRPLI